MLARGITPRAEETLVRLASWMSFEDAQELLHDLLGVRMSTATARRATLATGTAALSVCEQQQERLKQELPPAPAGAEKQAMSVDGAFVPLVAGEWAEVKTLTLAQVTRNRQGEVCLEQVSSFSRLLDAERFTQAALVETQRRGLEQATEVCAVQDGAVWLQGVVDYHRADAVRILDFPHAAEYVNAIGQDVQAAGGRLPVHWLEGMLHRLKHLAFLAARYPSPAIQEHLSYLQKREAHMQYPTFQAAGWPIGSGSVESANKLVVEARLKGAGMRWQGTNVNPMLVLRNAVCNRDWQQTWTTARAYQGTLRRRERQADSQQQLSGALWMLAYWSLRLTRLSQPSVSAVPAPVVETDTPQPTRRLGTGYSWRQPFLRRPPSTPARSPGTCAKK